MNNDAVGLFQFLIDATATLPAERFIAKCEELGLERLDVEIDMGRWPFQDYDSVKHFQVTLAGTRTAILELHIREDRIEQSTLQIIFAENIAPIREIHKTIRTLKRLACESVGQGHRLGYLADRQYEYCNDDTLCTVFRKKDYSNIIVYLVVTNREFQQQYLDGLAELRRR